MLAGAARRLTGLAPLLAVTSAVTSAPPVPAAVGTVARWGATSVGAALAPPAAVVRRVAAVAHRPPARRVWSVEGRAQIGVLGLEGAAAAGLAERVEKALAAVDGVRWARVDGPTRRAVVRFDPDRVGTPELVATVAAAEATAGVDPAEVPHPAPVDLPVDPAPVRDEGWALAADLAGLAAAVTAQLTRLPALPGSVAAGAVLVDTQPRLRRLVESGLGEPAADLVLAAANAVSLALTHGTAALVVDAAQRSQAFSAARARRAAFAGREAELWSEDRPGRADVAAAGERPVPLPAGPVERYADRAATGSLLAAGGVLAATRDVDLAGRVFLVGAPRPPRAAREAFADTLTRTLSRRGVLVLHPAALRVLDRVDTVLVDTRVLHTGRPLAVSVQPLPGSPLADAWSTERLWTVAQRLLWEHPEPSPPGQHRRRLELVRAPVGSGSTDGGDGSGLETWLLTERGTPVGEVRVAAELDPFTDAVLGSVQAAGTRLVLTADAGATELAGRADEVVERQLPLAAHVRRLQAAGRVVAVVSTEEDALAPADVALGVVPAGGRVPWAADLLTGPRLDQLPLLIGAVPVARALSARGVRAALAGTFLGGLLTAVGGTSRRRATLPVTGATAVALVDGVTSARRLARRPAPAPVLHTPWHALAPDEVLARLPRPAAPEPGAAPARPARSSAAGTVLAVARTIGAELADPLTPVLGTGAVASAVIGSVTDAFLVGGVVLGDATISGLQRFRATQALRDLLAGQELTARVRSGDDGGRVTTVRAGALRVGQLIELRAGDVVPADGRLLAVDGLEVDEATLTGESAAVDKQVAATPGAELPDRACMVYEGTSVLAGTARAAVVATGAATEAGRALALAAGAAAPAGMQARLEELTRRVLPVTLLGGAAVTGVSLLRGRPLRQALGSGISVAVAAVPEGLPLVATVAQMGAARRLSNRQVLVRSARTVEALGRVDTVCFDKTGTLTQGRLELVRVAGPAGQWGQPGDPAGLRVLRAAVRACPQPEDGRPPAHATDRAILDAAERLLPDAEEQEWEELSELPFQSDRGFSAALGRTPRLLRLVVKGAPEVVLPRCTHVRDADGKRHLDAAAREQARATVHRLAADGLRVLAVARRSVGHRGDEPADGGALDPEEFTEDLTLLGFVALVDVPRPEAAVTVAALHAAGLSTVMITGDHPVTARAIAAGLGIPADPVVTGPELAALDEPARTELVGRASVFARVSPEQKLRIVTDLQRAGRVVAMTGDGANDAAAIRLADVGIGMTAHGSTTARSAADLVLTTPDLRLLLDALVEGRAMWGRVRDAVALLLGGNAGEVGFTLLATALAGRAPMGARQFLLVNMLTDLLPSMAIAVAPTPQEPAERLALLTSGAPSLGGPLVRDIAVRGLGTAGGSLVAWQIGRVTGTRRRAGTMALAALVGTQLGQTLLAGGRDPLVAVTAVGSVVALAAVIQLPGLSQFFGCTPLGPVAWSTVVGCAAAGTALAVVLDRVLPPIGAPEPAPAGSTQDGGR